MEHGPTHNSVEGADVAGPLFQGYNQHVVINQMPAPTPVAAPAADDADAWVGGALGSAVWRHVTPGRDAAAQQAQVGALVAELARMRDRLEEPLSQDPWRDPGIPVRFLDNLGRLLGDPEQPPRLDLYPAEAALFVLLPFLHRVHYLRQTARLVGVGPGSLRPEPGAGPDRKAYETFVGDDDTLLQRALRSPAGEAEVGWWLFHRWVVQHREFAPATSVADLLGELGAPARALGGVLDSSRLTALLQGLRRGPDVCHTEFLKLLEADESVHAGTGAGYERIREQRLALLVALAYAMSIEMTALPDIIAEHLPIPAPVKPAELRRTLEQATWGGPPDLPVLKAACHHEAVVEGLREYTARADELLHTVRRTVRERITPPMPALPTRLSTDGVVPTGDAFDGYARFRSDGRRFRDLAMGIELYKDRDLAVRELYQNALDACRYRKARSEYLDRTGPVPWPYEGKITLTQGRDEAGRAYLECHDDGVGMGESELRGVFAQAGSRFAEQLEFKLERAAWEALDPPVTLYPNSRFGIGVLSYFMLADEIHVTTCRMGPEGDLGPVYEVAICGPGHLFRIKQAATRWREPGTTVRLYLRGDVDVDTWSCVVALESVLAIAEFRTVAEDGRRDAEWLPGQLKGRERQGGASPFSLHAFGEQVPWPGAPDGAQVIWCEFGGALLVDGLLAHPTTGHGVLTSSGARLTGAVVNLRGRWAPAKLSVDRRHVLDDVTSVVRTLLEQAAEALPGAEQRLLGFEWLCTVAKESALLGDIITAAFLARGRELTFRGMTFGSAGSGVFPADFSFGPRGARDTVARRLRLLPPGTDPRGFAPDHIYLWRVLARRSERDLGELAELCPEIEENQAVREAVPSDQSLLMGCRASGFSTDWVRAEPSLRDVAFAARILQSPPRAVAQRVSELGFDAVDPRNWSADAQLTVANAWVVSRALRRGGELTPNQLMVAAEELKTDVGQAAECLRLFGLAVTDETVDICRAALNDPLLWPQQERRGSGCLPLGVAVPIGHLAKASLILGLSVPEVCTRLAAYGLPCEPGLLPDHPSKETVLLLSAGGDGLWPWVDPVQGPAPGQVLVLAKERGLEPVQVLEKLDALGVARPAYFPTDAVVGDLPFLVNGPPRRFHRPPTLASYEDLFDGAQTWDALRAKLRRLADYGFTSPFRVPRRPTVLDDEIFSSSQEVVPWGELEMDAVVPFAYVVVLARAVGATPAVVAKRLRAWGLETSHDALPFGMSMVKALRLLQVEDYSGGDELYAEDFPLQYLHRAARQHGTTIAQVATWLQQLGIPVPDPAETVRAALARVPRGGAG